MGLPDDRRGQSETMGVVLLLGITVIGTTAVLALGLGVLGDAQSEARSGSAEHAMAQLDSEASLVAIGDSNQRFTEVPLGGDGNLRVEPTAGWMNVTLRDTGGAFKQVILDRRMGAVIYSQGDTSIAYQGGGVWRRSSAGATMVSPPEVHYEGTTLTMPLVTVGGQGGLTESLQITENGSQEPLYPNRSGGDLNPVEEGKLEVNITSQYFRSWGRFFEQRIGGDVTYEPDEDRVIVDLIVPSSNTNNVNTALALSNAGGTFKLSGGGGNPTFVDSYNSSQGPYTSSKSWDGTIETAGDLEFAGNAEVRGDVRSGGNIDKITGTSDLFGTAFYTVTPEPNPCNCNDSEQIDGVDPVGAITSRVNDKVDELSDSSNNGNGGESSIDGSNRLDFAAEGDPDVAELDAGGSYFLEEVDTDKKIVVEGDSETIIAVDGLFEIGGGNFTVQGGGVTRIYVTGDAHFEKNSVVHVPGDRSDHLWIYGREDMDIKIKKDAVVDAVIYAPGGSSGGATITPKQDFKGTVFGGLVVGKATMGPEGTIHFDQNISRWDPTPTTSSASRVTYLHVSVNPVNVTAGG